MTSLIKKYFHFSSLHPTLHLADPISSLILSAKVISSKNPSPMLIKSISLWCSYIFLIIPVSLVLPHFFEIVNWICVCQPQTGTCHECLPCTSTRIKSCAAATTDLQHPLKDFRMESSNLWMKISCPTICILEKIQFKGVSPTWMKGLFIRYS